MPDRVHTKMWTSDWKEEGEGRVEARKPEEGEVGVIYMNMGGSTDSPHEFL